MILVTGRGTSGSWIIRGQQLGAAIGAHVEQNASKVKGYDLAVIVKRPRPDMVYRLQQANIRIVWDIVDSYPQPQGNDWNRTQCLAWLKAEVQALKPVGLVAATEVMAVDCDFGVPVLALPHHPRPKQRMNPLREKVKTVGYQGGDYLGAWRPMLDAECDKRGWHFVVNPQELADVDIAVALRGQIGYAARMWKSNVKQANAQATGTPIVCNRAAAYQEMASGGEKWADTRAELALAFDELTHVDARREAASQLTARSLQDIAAEYRAWLLRLKS